MRVAMSAPRTLRIRPDVLVRVHQLAAEERDTEAGVLRRAITLGVAQLERRLQVMPIEDALLEIR